MNPVEPIRSGPGIRRVVFGAGQPEYNPLPALLLDTPERHVVSRWRPTEDERRAILDGACIELSQMTFGEPIQPVHMSVEGVGERIELAPADEPQ